MKSSLIHIATLIGFAAVAYASEVVNIDKNGLALQGYDPVGYFTDGKPVKGSPEFTVSYKGATYQFASAEHREMFQQNPARYEPQFGGFCGYAASINKLAPIEVDKFQVLHDRLILQHNKKAWDLWQKDVEGNLKKADANWPTLSQQKAP
jgi:YHS domain-containing protein